MLAQIVTIICAATMTLSLCVEAGSFFHRGDASLTASASTDAPDLTPHRSPPAPQSTS
ncbi:MAG: hypothetical protein K0V04_25645 [Deltaproteobacteria bacterium]|nr:hypothetical protein [Deltaproteobacteria bacterium]